VSREFGALDQEIVTAWLEAAQDLGIRVTAPFGIMNEIDETEIYEALIHDFGGPKGTLTGRTHDFKSDPMESRSKAGYYASNLANSYRKYDPEYFKATLDDWQWFGDTSQRPSWYTGKPWS
jgi:hypothetical protein